MRRRARTCLSHRSDLVRRHAGELNPTFAADLRLHFLSGSTLGFDPHSDAHAFSLALCLALASLDWD